MLPAVVPCAIGRAPRGARGLKHVNKTALFDDPESRPPRGAWIETSKQQSVTPWLRVAPPAGRVD